MSVMQARKIVITSFKYHPGGGGGRPGNFWGGGGGGGGGGGLLGILGGDVPPSSSNPDPISDQKMSFFTPVFRLAFKKLLYHYLDWNSKKIGIYIFLCLSYIIWN